MAIVPSFMVNMSGKTVQVHGGENWNEVVGYLYPREAFSRYGVEGDWTSITFLGPDGKLTEGMLKGVEDFNVLSFCTDYPYSIEQIDSEGPYYVFKMRTTQSIYNAAGTKIGSVAAGKKVACKNAVAGQNYQWLKLIDRYQDANGVWQTPDKTGKKYGFVDTGLRTGSGYSKIAMYGSW